MDDNRKILTIAIPTYNRSKYLLECLNSIVPQINKNVELIISDNASQDNTKEVIEEYINKYPFIKYYRNKKNMGMDNNFLNCLRRASGDYVHIMSDDDIMLPNCINEIIRYINIYKDISLISLNDCKFQGVFIGVDKCSRVRMNLRQNIYTEDKNYFLSKVSYNIGFLSTLVFNRKYFKEIIKPEKYIGTIWLQSHIALICTKGNRKLGIIKHNCIAGRNGNGKIEADEWDRIFIKEFKNLLYKTGKHAGYSKKVLETVYLSMLKDFLPSVIIGNKLNEDPDFVKKQRKRIIKNTYKYFSAWILIYPFLFIPKFVLIILRKLYRILKNKKSISCI